MASGRAKGARRGGACVCSSAARRGRSRGSPMTSGATASSGSALLDRIPALRLFQRRSALGRLLPIRLSLCAIALLGIDPAPRQIRSSIARVEANRFPEARQRPIKVPGSGVGHAPVIPGAGIVRVEPNRLAEVRNSSVPLPLIKVGHPPTVIARCILRVDLDGPVEVVDRLGVFLAVYQAPPAPGGGLRRPAIQVEECDRTQKEDTDQCPAPRKPPHWEHTLPSVRSGKEALSPAPPPQRTARAPFLCGVLKWRKGTQPGKPGT